jgi:hypothetical protein
MANLVDRHLDIPVHDVDLAEVLAENGFLVDPGEEYLVDLVTWAVGDDARFGVDNVRYVRD